MAGSSGNGKADTLRETFARNQAAREQALERLEGIEWDEEITETNITVEKGATVVVTTGKHAAMSKDQADEITLTDHGVAPKKESDPPQSETPKSGVPGIIAALGGVAVRLIGAASKPLGLGALVVLAALVAYWLRLRYGH